MPDACDVMVSVVKEELDYLVVRPFDELTKLPSCTTRQVARDGYELGCTIYTSQLH